MINNKLEEKIDDIDIEERINNIFAQFDNYISHHSFDYLTIEMVTNLIYECAETRKMRESNNLSKDEKLYNIEKDLRWLKSLMLEHYLTKITRE